MYRAVSLLVIVLSPFAAAAADPWTGKTVFWKPESLASRAEANTLPFFARVEEVDGERLWLGRVWADKTDVIPGEEAIEFFTQRVRADPTSAAAWANRAAVWIWKGDHDKAEKDFAKAIEITPKPSPKLLNNRGRSLLMAGNAEDAIKHFDIAIQLNPKYAAAYQNRGDAWMSKGFFAEAIKDYTEAIAMDPANPESFACRAAARSDAGDNEGAMRDYDEAIKLDPKDAGLYCNRGNLWNTMGRNDAAIKDYTTAITLLPTLSVAYQNRGESWCLENQYDKAIADFSEAIRIDKVPRSFLGRAWACCQKGAYAEAVHDYSEVIRLGDKTADVFYRRAWALEKQGENVRAMEDLAEAVRISPRDAMLCNHVAWFHATCHDDRCRDGQAAIRNATSACELTDWKNGRFVGTLAAACAEAGEFDSAIKYQNKAIELNPDDADFVKGAKERLALFKDHKPYREE